MASLTLDFYQIAQVVGALQGLLLTGVLIAQRRNVTANRLLATLMATFTVFLLSGVYFSAGVFEKWPHLLLIGYQMPWVFGPLVFLFAVAASDRSWRFTRRTLVHFLPVTITVLAATPFYILSAAEKIAENDQWRSGNIPIQFQILDPSKYVSGLAYSIATVIFLTNHRKRVEYSYSNTERVNLRWLLFLSSAAFGIWLLATGLKLSGVASQVRDEYISLTMAILVYAIGYMGLRQPEVFRYETAEYPVPRLVTEDAPPPSTPDESEPDSTRRYERSGLDDLEAARLKARLLSLMDTQRPWQESELTLADLATRLDSTPHKLSEVLNSELGQTFYDFVNGYRVREVQRRIKAGDARALKMLALAMDAGFASKSTFNQAFKKHTNQTPSDFRQAVGA